MKALLIALAALALLAAVATAQAPPQVQLPATFPPECRWAHEPDGQISLACQPDNKRGWILRHVEDVEGGTFEHPNLNISGGSNPRGYVVITPDSGKGLIVENGRLRKLLLVRDGRYGGTEFRTPVRFENGLTVCKRPRRDCVDVMRALRRR